MKQEAETIELRGTVTAVIYQNEDNGYTILRLDAGEPEQVTVAGCLPGTAPGENLTIHGAWGSHPRYGAQFQAQWAVRTLPDKAQNMAAFLSSGALRGVGPKLAQAIVARFGADTMRVMEEFPEKLAQVKGITQKRALQIGAAFRRQTGVRRLIEFLQQYGLKPSMAMRLYKCYGDEAMQALQADPYILAGPYFGGSFHSADALAEKLGFDAGCPQRLAAALLFELSHNLSNGHCFIPRDKLLDATASLLGGQRQGCEIALDTLVENGEIVPDTVAGLDACYLARLYETENYVARRIQRMACAKPHPVRAASELLEALEAQTGITYTDRQKAAVAAAAKRDICILTGAPGTGKTTTVRAILALFDNLALETVLTAPTGRAAKRMSELCGREAVTVHRLLGAGRGGELDEPVFAKCESDPIKADAVILDETSMVDIFLLRALLAALPEGCRLLLVGDANQLPAVGPGNAFSDLIRSGMIETIRLSEIFRQAQESRIIQNAHRINRGELPNLRENTRDFFFLQRRDPEKAVETVLSLCAKRLPENMEIPAHQIQVLSPFKKGVAGTHNLNQRLQAALNPGCPEKKEKKFGEFVFREGDKVMQIRNNYDIMWKKADQTAGLGIYNGDIGAIVRISQREETLTVGFDDRLVTYGFEQLGELEPAYAMTVHKSQGSEYRAVILVAERGPAMLLARKVLYTAVTRARELLILVGDEQVIRTMTENNRQQRRYSGLKTRLAGE